MRILITSRLHLNNMGSETLKIGKQNLNQANINSRIWSEIHITERTSTDQISKRNRIASDCSPVTNDCDLKMVSLL